MYIANREKLKQIQPIFYDPNYARGTTIQCWNDTQDEQSVMCAGYCTLRMGVDWLIKGCNESLSSDNLGINMSLGLSYPSNQQFKTQVSSLVLVCNKEHCNSNRSISEAMTIVNNFLTAPSTGCPCQGFERMSIALIALLVIFFCSDAGENQ